MFTIYKQVTLSLKKCQIEFDNGATLPKALCNDPYVILD